MSNGYISFSIFIGILSLFLSKKSFFFFSWTIRLLYFCNLGNDGLSKCNKTTLASYMPICKDMKSPTKCTHSSLSYWVTYKLTEWIKTRIWLSLLSLFPCIILFYLRHLASTNWSITLSNRPPPCALVLIGLGPSPKLIVKPVSLYSPSPTYSKAVDHWCTQAWRGSWNWNLNN